ncbi:MULTISPECIES: UPF0058 family protein [unclassified Haladaptatus]|uniref:UPF0058 family protein n=1 Tax=unclassified Haladaptatus TaxID=2622732 RepID=UPI00209C1E91|nr:MULTISPECIES: UPF0058 family protein [unclassified Haladaptatus]MCO8245112.1 UPF0058 family protein [Haladaptatus sp. AB643]MCO8253255.1 UPF0058 family protein [Haladaptatus sp. AB618]
MKKQELIHLHGLLAEVGNHFEKRDGEQISLDEYDSLGVRPTSIHKSKTDHKAAVFALSEAITSGMSETERKAVAPQAD